MQETIAHNATLNSNDAIILKSTSSPPSKCLKKIIDLENI